MSRSRPSWPRRLARDLFLGACSALFCARPRRSVALPDPCILIANHGSHLDTVALLASLTSAERDRARPLAALDYWGSGFWRRLFAVWLLNSVLIDRRLPGAEALLPAEQALREGFSLIMFPEGTRSAQALPGPFKTGAFYLSRSSGAPLTPVYLSNSARIMPKGALLPIPLAARAHFGQPSLPGSDEPARDAMERLRQTVIALAD